MVVRRVTLTTFLLVLVSVAPAVAGDIFSAALNGLQEVPQRTTAATAAARLAYHRATTAFDLDIFVAGIPAATIRNTYLNIHTPTFPGGEIRGQVVLGPPKLVVTAAGQGGGPHVSVFDPFGVPRFEFLAFNPLFTGGVHVATCDLNGDGFPDILVAAGPGGGPHVQAFDGLNGQPLSQGSIGSFFAYNPAFAGGVFVGCAG